MKNEEALDVLNYLSNCEDVSPYHKEALNILLDDYERIKETWNNVKREIEQIGATEQETNGKTDYLKGITTCLDIIDQYNKT